MKFQPILIITFFLLSSFISGCSSQKIKLNEKSHTDAIHELGENYNSLSDLSKEDKKEGRGNVWNETNPLTLEQAIKRAKTANIELRLAALTALAEKDKIPLEELKALPEFKAVYTSRGRNNLSASRSQSVLTGAQNLGPSVSSDQYRQTFDLDTRWNLLDVALALSRSERTRNQAEALKEQYARAYHSLRRDVTDIFWRAYIWQVTGQEIQKQRRDLTKLQDKFAKAQETGILSSQEAGQKNEILSSKLRALSDFQRRFSQAETELKKLLSLPFDQPVILSRPDENIARQAADLLSENIEAQEQEALLHRPEMRAAFLRQNAAHENIRQEILKTFPGAEAFLGVNWDSNSFLLNNNFNDFFFSLSQSLTDILTFQQRRQAAQSELTTQKNRSLALYASILSQIRLSRLNLQI